MRRTGCLVLLIPCFVTCATAWAPPMAVLPRPEGPLIFSGPVPGEARGIYIANATGLGRFPFGARPFPLDVQNIEIDAKRSRILACGPAMMAGVDLSTGALQWAADLGGLAPAGCEAMAVNRDTGTAFVAAKGGGVFAAACSWVGTGSLFGSGPPQGGSGQCVTTPWPDAPTGVTAVWFYQMKYEGSLASFVALAKGDTIHRFSPDGVWQASYAVRGLPEDFEPITSMIGSAGSRPDRGRVYVASGRHVFLTVSVAREIYVLNSEALPEGCSSTRGVVPAGGAYMPLCYDSRTQQSSLTWWNWWFSKPDQQVPAIAPFRPPPEPSLNPTNIAYDRALGRWLVGSTRLPPDNGWRVFEFDKDGEARGAVPYNLTSWGVEFTLSALPTGRDVGMLVDHKRQALIIVQSSTGASIQHLRGMNFLGQILLRENTVRPADYKAHGADYVFNDAAVSAEGCVFITEWRESEVYRAMPNRGVKSLFAAGGVLTNMMANGIAVVAGADGREVLLVAAMSSLVRIGGDICAAGTPKCCGPKCGTAAHSCEEGLPTKVDLAGGGWAKELGGGLLEMADGMKMSPNGRDLYVVDHDKRVLKLQSNDGWLSAYVANYLDVPAHCHEANGGDFNGEGVFTYLCKNPESPTLFEAHFPTPDRAPVRSMPSAGMMPSDPSGASSPSAGMMPQQMSMHAQMSERLSELEEHVRQGAGGGGGGVAAAFVFILALGGAGGYMLFTHRQALAALSSKLEKQHADIPLAQMGV